MPRLATLRVSVLDQLARQLRYESRDAARRQLARAEELAMDLLEQVARGELGAAFPEEWVIFRITGLRVDQAQPSSIVGEALLGDIGAFIERLSIAAGMRMDELDGKVRWMTPAEVAQRWKTSRKTVERARRRGLVGRRVQVGTTAGRQRVVYSVRAVEAYERAWGVGGEQAEKGRPRLTEAESARIVRRARGYRRRLGWTLDACARRLAERHGRSRQTIRRALEAHERTSGSPIFDEPGPVTPAQARGVERVVRAGGSASGAARELSKSRASVYRLLHQQRGARLRAVAGMDAERLRGPVSPLFVRSDAAEVLLGHPAVRTGLGSGGPSTVGELVELALASGTGRTGVEESAMARAYWFLLYRSKQGLGSLSRSSPRVGGTRGVRGSVKKNEDLESGGLDRIETDLRWAARLKAELVRCQLPAMLRTIDSQLEAAGVGGDAGRGVGDRVLLMPGVAAVGLVRACLAALSQSVEQFDPFKGGRLAGASALAISRAVAQWARTDEGAGWVARLKDGVRGATRAAEGGARGHRIEDFALNVCVWQRFLDVPAVGRSRVKMLAPRQRLVIEARMGWAGAAPKTLAEIAAEIGSTATRVAAIERRAIAMLEAKK